MLTCRASASASLYTATVLMPNSRAVRITRILGDRVKGERVQRSGAKGERGEDVQRNRVSSKAGTAISPRLAMRILSKFFGRPGDSPQSKHTNIRNAAIA
jgi:hypothetical protein